jgi:hypothetical protein
MNALRFIRNYVKGGKNVTIRKNTEDGMTKDDFIRSLKNRPSLIEKTNNFIQKNDIKDQDIRGHPDEPRLHKELLQIIKEDVNNDLAIDHGSRAVNVIKGNAGNTIKNIDTKNISMLSTVPKSNPKPKTNKRMITKPLTGVRVSGVSTQAEKQKSKLAFLENVMEYEMDRQLGGYSVFTQPKPFSAWSGDPVEKAIQQEWVKNFTQAVNKGEIVPTHVQTAGLGGGGKAGAGEGGEIGAVMDILTETAEAAGLGSALNMDPTIGQAGIQRRTHSQEVRDDLDANQRVLTNITERTFNSQPVQRARVQSEQEAKQQEQERRMAEEEARLSQQTVEEARRRQRENDPTLRPPDPQTKGVLVTGETDPSKFGSGGDPSKFGSGVGAILGGRVGGRVAVGGSGGDPSGSRTVTIEQPKKGDDKGTKKTKTKPKTKDDDDEPKPPPPDEDDPRKKKKKDDDDPRLNPKFSTPAAKFPELKPYFQVGGESVLRSKNPKADVLNRALFSYVPGYVYEGDDNPLTRLARRQWEYKYFNTYPDAQYVVTPEKFNGEAPTTVMRDPRFRDYPLFNQRNENIRPLSSQNKIGKSTFLDMHDRPYLYPDVANSAIEEGFVPEKNFKRSNFRTALKSFGQ